jgi:ankyrin repeat protein
MFTFTSSYTSEKIYNAIVNPPPRPPSDYYTTWFSYIKDVSYVDSTSGNTFLHLATHVENGKPLTSLLKTSPPKILNCKNKKGNTPFVECLLHGDPTNISLFFNRDGLGLTISVDPTIENDEGINGLHAYCSITEKHFGNLQLLFDKAMATRFKESGKLNSQTKLGLTPLMILCKAEWIDMKLIRVLMEYGASLDMRDSNKNTALMMLLKRDDIRNVNIGLIEDMIKKVNDINIQNTEGDTMLHIACKNPDMIHGIVKLLLTHRINPLLENSKKEKPSSRNPTIQEMLKIAQLPTRGRGGSRRKRRKIKRTRHN